MSTFRIHLQGGSTIYRYGLSGTLSSLYPSAQINTTDSSQVNDLTIYTLGPEEASIGMAQLKRCMKHPLLGRILVIGPYLKTMVVKGIVQAGASGYLLRKIEPDQLETAVDASLRGDTYIDKSLREEWLNHQFGASSYRTRSLTRREKQVLQLIVEENTTDEIAERLFISSCTVESHRANISSKLEVRNVAGIVREAIRRDLCTI